MQQIEKKYFQNWVMHCISKYENTNFVPVPFQEPELPFLENNIKTKSQLIENIWNNTKIKRPLECWNYVGTLPLRYKGNIMDIEDISQFIYKRFNRIVGRNYDGIKTCNNEMCVNPIHMRGTVF